MKNITITLTDKRSSLFCLVISDKEKTFNRIDTQIFSRKVILTLGYLEIICQGQNKHSSLFCPIVRGQENKLNKVGETSLTFLLFGQNFFFQKIVKNFFSLL
jgi:hypothetical protein